MVILFLITFRGYSFTKNYLNLNETKRELAKKKREEEKRKKQERLEKERRDKELGALKLLEAGSDDGEEGTEDSEDEDLE
jgi:CelD/BcsL family acetyltransferase involved in cellulose biosynthesis